MTAARIAPALVILGIVAVLAVGGAGAVALSIQAGEWEVTVRTSIKSMPNVPPEVAKMMGGPGAKPVVVRHCITPADLKSNPEAMLGKRAPGCRYERFSLAGGQMTMRMVCAGPDGAVTTTSSRGNYTPLSYAVTGESVRVGPNPMAMTMAVTGRRVSPVCSSKG